ncbi:unnamed protein product [Moneuplotes crassus]|uniref:C2 domain-containing protein n=2 Tax=Euplotes crassus TaxID=5936 RepID=A0AAD1YDI1_EUPCR|nr:unnamed protein product [Moneuplotes crassus]
MDPLKKVEYLVGATVIEGRGLTGKDRGGTSDPFVKVSCANSDTQISQRLYSTNNAVWNQSFTFEKVLLNKLELESMELVYEVYDYNAVLANELIGYHSVGLSTMYRHLNHEFYRKWVPLFNSEIGPEPQGQLLISCFIIGPGEKPPAHRKDEIIDDDEEDLDEILGPDVSEAKKRELQEKKKGIFLLTNPKNQYKTYQLNINILKVEGLPYVDGKKGPTTYCSARVMGNTICTGTVKESVNPAFNQKLSLPVILPTLNDKILIKIWMDYSLTSVDLLANLPEVPRKDDIFNISILQGNEGWVTSKWYNMYGTHPEDRAYFFTPATSYYLEGNSFLGRALISMNINPVEKPQFAKSSANLLREPQAKDYVLFCEPYEISNITETQGKDVRIEVTFGLAKQFTKQLKYNSGSKNYKFKLKHKIKPIKISYPEDLKQVPDIIVTLQAQKLLGGIWKVGYFRIKPRELLDNDCPRWYKFKSLEKPHSSPGKLLCNFTLVHADKANTIRRGKKKSAEVQFKFYYNIFYCLDISIDQKNEEKVESKLRLEIGSNKIKSTDWVKNHIPLWNCSDFKDLTLPKNLSFAPDLSIYLVQKGWFGGEKDVGEVHIPLSSIKEDFSEPKFYQFTSYGEIKGKLLAIFNIAEKDAENNDSDLQNKVDANSDFFTNSDITFSIIGIRNLVNLPNDIKMEVSLLYLKPNEDTGYLMVDKAVEEEKEEIKEESDPEDHSYLKSEEESNESYFDDDEELGLQNKKEQLERKSVNPELLGQVAKKNAGMTKNETLEAAEGIETKQIEDPKKRNQTLAPMKDPGLTPNFCTRVEFKNVPFCKHPFLWPIIVIKVRDTGYFSGAENLELIFPLINYVNFLSPKNKSLNLNDLKIAYKQKLSDLETSTNKTETHVSNSDEDTLENEESEDEDEGEETKESGEENSSEEEDKKETSKEMEEQDSAEEIDEDKVTLKNHELYKQYHKRIKQIKAPPLSDRAADVAFSNMYGDFYVDDTEKITLDVCKKDKEFENDLREKQLDILYKKKEDITTKLRKSHMPKEKEKNRNLLILNRKKIEELENEDMDEDKFWNYMNSNDNEFNYGRDVLTDRLFEQMIALPYFKFELKTMPEMTFSELDRLDLRETSYDGNQKRFLKAFITVTATEESIRSKELEGTTKHNELEIFENSNLKKLSTDGDDDYFTQKIESISSRFPFDLADEEFMKIVREESHFICRVYVLRCQNLAGTTSNANIKDRLAGYSANCTADPYLVIKIGDGKSAGRGNVKMINEKDNAQENTLNPEFYQVYEFDISLPKDWTLTVEVLDKNNVVTESILGSTLIGKTVIDLEDRYYGDPHLTIRKKLETYRRMYQRELALLDRGRKTKEQEERKLELKSLQKDIAAIYNELDKEESPRIPVEFRELMHPKKKQSQGIIEMFTEIFPAKDSKLHKLVKIKPPSKEEFELRLIIWGTREIKLVNGESVDIFVRVIFDPHGWSKETIERTTDTHYNSKDGRGEFNWRMKFPIELPCEFPRLKIQVYGFGVITNEIIGENTINIQKALQNLVKEGSIEIPNTWINLQNPEDEHEDVGSLKFSMTIVSKMMAEGNPVGEAWDEPNENPRLIPPTAGRGFGDKFASLAFDIGKWKWPAWLMFRNFAIFGVILSGLGLVGAMVAMRMA